MDIDNLTDNQKMADNFSDNFPQKLVKKTQNCIEKAQNGVKMD